MAITLKDLKNERLRRYVEAETAVLKGQSYMIGDRQLTRANLAEIRRAIEDLLADGATLDGEELKVGRIKRVVFYD